MASEEARNWSKIVAGTEGRVHGLKFRATERRSQVRETHLKIRELVTRRWREIVRNQLLLSEMLLTQIANSKNLKFYVFFHH